MERERERLMKELQEAIHHHQDSLRPPPHLRVVQERPRRFRLLDARRAIIEQHSQATFSHSVCPECATRYFGPEIDRTAERSPPAMLRNPLMPPVQAPPAPGMIAPSS